MFKWLLAVPLALMVIGICIVSALAETAVGTTGRRLHGCTRSKRRQRRRPCIIEYLADVALNPLRWLKL